MDDYDPTNIRGQELAQADAKTQAKLADETEGTDLVWLMSSKRGRRIVWRILSSAGVFNLTFNSDPLVMAFGEGARSQGLRMLARLHELCPQRYTTMVKEQASV
ncbi:MAG: endopeptidase [Gammaproteobacteria bacterium]|nr:endopeptidase [Gammaproteobacteria bacterium]